MCATPTEAITNKLSQYVDDCIDKSKVVLDDEKICKAFGAIEFVKMFLNMDVDPIEKHLRKYVEETF